MLLVVGNCRLGTSTCARVLETRCGIDMGGPGMPLEGTRVPSYERGRIVALHRAASLGHLDMEGFRAELYAEGMWWKQPAGASDPYAIPWLTHWIALWPDLRIIWCAGQQGEQSDGMPRADTCPEAGGRGSHLAGSNAVQGVMNARPKQSFLLRLDRLRGEDTIADALDLWLESTRLP